MIAALFVQTDGCYFGLDQVDPWDEQRDARLYAGPYPVVAHPPCQLWVNFAALNFKRYGGDRNRPGNDGGCFESALASVRRCGGVLEHPAFSKAWERYELMRPIPGKWAHFWSDEPGGAFRRNWVCEVWQSAYGHRARKRTWLLYSGTEAPPEMRWEQPPGVAQVGWFDRVKPTLSKREASATPVAFRDELIAMARSVTARRAA